MTDEKDREDLRLEGLRGYRYDKRFKPLSVDGPDALPLGHRIVSTINLSTGEKGRASLTDTGRLDELTSDPSTPLPALTSDRRRAWVVRDGDIGIGPPPKLFAEDARRKPYQCTARACEGPGALRSEEHTSELQSLMRISYAVFCLKQKKHTSTP